MMHFMQIVMLRQLLLVLHFILRRCMLIPIVDFVGGHFNPVDLQNIIILNAILHRCALPWQTHLGTQSRSGG
jgi:hypothetical protein